MFCFCFISHVTTSEKTETKLFCFSFISDVTTALPVKWLTVKTVSRMTYNVLHGTLNIQSTNLTVFQVRDFYAFLKHVQSYSSLTLCLRLMLNSSLFDRRWLCNRLPGKTLLRNDVWSEMLNPMHLLTHSWDYHCRFFLAVVDSLCYSLNSRRGNTALLIHIDRLLVVGSEMFMCPIS